MYGSMDGAKQQWDQNQQYQQDTNETGGAEIDNARRPPNAFILYSQENRSKVQQDNPTCSNTEVSRLLGKMWKEIPNNSKLAYKQKAQLLQEEFKRQHPDYTYRKARRKTALNELLTKSSQAFPPSMAFPAAMDPSMAAYQPMVVPPQFYSQMQGYQLPQQQNGQIQSQQQQPIQPPIEFGQIQSYPQQMGQQFNFPMQPPR